VNFPFGVAAVDGKSITCKEVDREWTLAHTIEAGKPTVGLVRTVTVCLASSASKLCIDAIPIPGSTNEVGHLRYVVDELHRVYGKSGMIRMFTYDAGGCSEENAAYIVEKGYDYTFAVKDSQPQLLDAMKRALESAPRSAKTEDVLSDKSLVTRRLHIVSPKMEAIRWGNHAKTFLCVVSKKHDKHGNLLSQETRYFVSSLHSSKLTKEQWLSLVRNHWAVENACHFTYDVAFKEDHHPWTRKAPKAILVMAILRRIACNMLALLRTSSRSEPLRDTGFIDLLRHFYNFAIAAGRSDLDGFRQRKAVTVFS
jgi:predicted transposase YbfD/YdcC